MTNPSPRVLITRESAEPLAALLRELGLSVAHVPLLSLRPTSTPPPNPPPSIVLISSAATARLATGLAAQLAGVRVVALGEKTAAALRRVGIEPVAVGEGGGESAVALLARHSRSDDRVGYVGATELSAPLSEALARWGRRVVRWSVYENVTPPEAAELARLSAGAAAVTLASPSAARRYVALGGDLRVPAAVIGPATASAAASAGLLVGASAAAPSMASLALAAAAVSRGSSGG